MKKETIETVKRAINEKFYLYKDLSGFGTPAWYRPLRIDGEHIIMLWGDCGNENRKEDLYSWTEEDWETAMIRGGLNRKIGFWDFIPVENPAYEEIIFCQRSPKTAGLTMYSLIKEIDSLTKKLKEVSK